MDQKVLVTNEIEAGANLIRELGEFAPIKAAFWLKRDEEDQKKLYLASDRFNWADRPAAYREVLRILSGAPTGLLDYDEVSLLPGDDRWVAAAEEWSGGRVGTKLRSTSFAGEYITEAYIYPSPLPENFPYVHRPSR